MPLDRVELRYLCGSLRLGGFRWILLIVEWSVADLVAKGVLDIFEDAHDRGLVVELGVAIHSTSLVAGLDTCCRPIQVLQLLLLEIFSQVVPVDCVDCLLDLPIQRIQKSTLVAEFVGELHLKITLGVGVGVSVDGHVCVRLEHPSGHEELKHALLIEILHSSELVHKVIDLGDDI